MIAQEAQLLREWLKTVRVHALENGPYLDEIIALRMAFAECMREIKASLDAMEVEIDQATKGGAE